MSSETSQYFMTCLYSFAQSQFHLQQVRKEDSDEFDLDILDKAMLWLTKAIRSIEVRRIGF